MQFSLADAVYAIYFYRAAAVLFWILWGNCDILVQKPVGLANLFSVLFVYFLFLNLCWRWDANQTLYPNQLQSRKFSFLAKAPSSSGNLRLLVSSNLDTFEAWVQNLHCGIPTSFGTLKHSFQGSLDVYNFSFLTVPLALQNSLLSNSA